MCIIIHKPRKQNVSLNRLFRLRAKHPHGFGVAWADKKKVNIFKTMDFDKFLEKYAKVSRYDCIIHFRFATRGKKEKINCHPFRINQNLVMAHNGTLKGLEGTSEHRSDSRVFAHSYLRPLVEEFEDFAYSTIGKKWMRKFTGLENKLIFMNNMGKVSIVNKDLGEMSHGCWYSNDSYKSYSLHLQRRKTYQPKAKPKDIIPMSYGALKTGRSLVDEAEDLFSDLKL